jgi:uncharacterized membrane protein
MDDTLPAEQVRVIPPQRMGWLAGEVDAWRASGLVSEAQAEAILGRYRSGRSFGLARLLLAVGAAFVGVGLIWLVAANLDRFSPTLRFTVVAAGWVGLTLLAEWLAGRRGHGGPVPSPVVGAARGVAVLAFGAAVFQAAQSLQVPAYEPGLLGVWGLGALAYAYLLRAATPLLVGILAGAGWVLWEVLWTGPTLLDGVLALQVLAVLAVSLGVVHDGWLPDFAAPWREIGAVLTLAALFVAALPFGELGRVDTDPLLLGTGVAATAALVTALVRGRGLARLEPLVAVASGAVAVALVAWETTEFASEAGASEWAHAAVAVTAYVALALGVAVLGTLRDSWRLTAVATAALVVFTTVQSFAVFAQIITGAWLFLVLGSVLIATGVGFDRARRRLAARIEDEEVAR